MSRKFTPEDIRRIGDTTIPAVESSYDELKSLVTGAKSAVEGIFGSASVRPAEAAEQFNTLWGRFLTVAEETPETLDAMGRTFVDIADRYDEDEAQTELDLQEALSDLEDVYTGHSETTEE
ncbi:hypothetical protein GCM10027447_14790 [Glycomyces halotolerans]